MKNLLLVLGIIGAILFFTNPKPLDHKTEVKRALKAALNNSISKNTDNIWIKGLGAYFGDAIVDSIADKIVYSKNYYLFSETHIAYLNYDYVVGYGVLGNVYVSDRLQTEMDNIFSKGKDIINEFTNSDNESEQTNNEDISAIDSTEVAPSYNDIKPNTYCYVNASEDNYVYFYDSPDVSARRNSYFTSRESVQVSEIDNGFGFVEFVNDRGESSSGWILLSNLTY